MINILLFVTYALIFIGLAACIVFPLMHMSKNPKGAKKSMIGIGGIIVLFILAYAVSSSDVAPALVEKFGTTPGTSKRVGAALIMVYITGIAAAGLTIFAELKQLIKK
ncbi:MAG: hypothetical protein HKN22_03125 [Bacteroidia bacterium]|nr:hypothetical protein [Bacteroidia bacterium]